MRIVFRSVTRGVILLSLPSCSDGVPVPTSSVDRTEITIIITLRCSQLITILQRISINDSVDNTIDKKDDSMSIYRDPLRKVNFICSKTVIRLIF